MRKIILQDVEIEKEEIRRLRRNIGSEFLGEFTKALKKKDITHYFNYPRYPKG